MNAWTRLRWRIAARIAPGPLNPPWNLARFDRLYEDPEGMTHILAGNEGHSGPSPFHHGPRRRCPVCRWEPARTTTCLPLRFPDGQSYRSPWSPSGPAR